jgi:hypothetical protein
MSDHLSQRRLGRRVTGEGRILLPDYRVTQLGNSGVNNLTAHFLLARAAPEVETSIFVINEAWTGVRIRGKVESGLGVWPKGAPRLVRGRKKRRMTRRR